jgi:hypothetical protein
MAYVCLLLSGAALLINGLATLGALPRRDAAVLSLVIGSLQLLLGITYLAVTYLGNVRLDSTAPDADGGVQLLLSASGMFLFGLTYVYVGLDFLLGLGSRGLGRRDGQRNRRQAVVVPNEPITAVEPLAAAVVVPNEPLVSGDSSLIGKRGL